MAGEPAGPIGPVEGDYRLPPDDTGEAISAVGIPSLTRALERESGLAEEEVSGDDSALLARVDKEYQRYFTAAKGNPAGEYKESAAALAHALVDGDARRRRRELAALDRAPLLRRAHLVVDEDGDAGDLGELT